MPQLPVPDEQTELAETVREMRRLSAAQRVALFVSLMETVETIQATLPREERWRRLRIAEQIDGPSPQPWWMGVRPDARP